METHPGTITVGRQLRRNFCRIVLITTMRFNKPA
jgi:hypothetical protein